MEIGLTVPQIATRLGVPAHRVKYVLETRRIEPMGRLGITRVFSEEQVLLIRAGLEQTAKRGDASKANSMATREPGGTEVSKKTRMSVSACGLSTQGGQDEHRIEEEA